MLTFDTYQHLPRCPSLITITVERTYHTQFLSALRPDPYKYMMTILVSARLYTLMIPYPKVSLFSTGPSPRSSLSILYVPALLLRRSTRRPSLRFSLAPYLPSLH